MFAALFVLVILPWLDTSKVRSAVFRPLIQTVLLVFNNDVIGLGYMGAMPAEGLYLLIARVATIYYFAHFLIIMPFLGYKEKTFRITSKYYQPVLVVPLDPSVNKAKSSKI